MTLSVREKLLHYAHWYVDHKGSILYEEVRPFPLGAHLPQHNDCSATFTNIYYLAGAPDPNHLNFSGYGNTATLAEHGQRIDRDIRIGDAVIFYEGGFNPYDSVHVAMIVGNTGPHAEDFLTMSHGESSQPSFVTVSSDGRAHRYFRYAVNER